MTKEITDTAHCKPRCIVKHKETGFAHKAVLSFCLCLFKYEGYQTLYPALIEEFIQNGIVSDGDDGQGTET